MSAFRLLSSMPYGARGSSFSAAKDGGWKNPYVTDGLVAMWDGEWNAGPGVHDPNATVWKNIVSDDYHLTFNNSYFRFGDNYFERYVRSRTPANYNGVIPCGCIESVADFNALTFCYTFMSPDVVPDVRYLNANSSGINVGKFNNSHYGFATSVNGTTHSVTINYNGSTSCEILSAFLNGWEQAVRKVSYAQGNAAGTFCVSGRNNNIVPIEPSKIFNLRCYSRALTAAEVAANYAVDKARFNLP